MLRMQDFKCATHGIFEELLVIDMRDSEARFDAVRSHACPQCGEASPGVWTKAPGIHGIYTHTVAFGGRVYEQGDLEERLAVTNTPTPFYEKPGFEERVERAFQKNLEKAVAGTLAPAASEEQVAQVAEAITSKE